MAISNITQLLGEENPQAIQKYLTDLTDRHTERGIHPDHYSIFITSLLEAIEGCMGSDFTPDIHHSWIQVLSYVGFFIIQRSVESILAKQMGCFGRIRHRLSCSNKFRQSQIDVIGLGRMKGWDPDRGLKIAQICRPDGTLRTFTKKMHLMRRSSSTGNGSNFSHTASEPLPYRSKHKEHENKKHRRDEIGRRHKRENLEISEPLDDRDNKTKASPILDSVKVGNPEEKDVGEKEDDGNQTPMLPSSASTLGQLVTEYKRSQLLDTRFSKCTDSSSNIRFLTSSSPFDESGKSLTKLISEPKDASHLEELPADTRSKRDCSPLSLTLHTTTATNNDLDKDKQHMGCL